MKKQILLFIFLSVSVCVNSQDKDKDGVLDKDDECPEVAGLVSLNGCSKVDKTITFSCWVIASFDRGVCFKTNKSKLVKEVISKLDTMVLIMKKYPTSNFTIKGFIDKEEKSKKNTSLSQKRAKVVFDYLVSKGISTKRLSLIDDGKDDTAIDNKIFKGVLNNKRVEISLDKREE